MNELREDRASRLITLTVRIADKPSIAAVLRNVSSHGLSIATDVCILPGQPLEIDLPGIGWVHGHVRARSGRIGVQLEEPIRPELVVASKPIYEQPDESYARALKVGAPEQSDAKTTIRRKLV